MCLAVAAHAAPDNVSMEAEATYKDVQMTLGSVPGFIKAYPQSSVAGAWEFFKRLQVSNETAIPPKYKELIGLAVSAQIPCTYCVYAHTEFAKANGATDEEIKHAVAEGSLTRLWSTYMNGLQQDEGAFKAELAKAVEAMKKMMAAPAPSTAQPAMAITDSKSAFADIERTFGVVPSFMRSLPDNLVAPAWKQMKAVEVSPGAIPHKYVSLISLAVASQIPCRYCVLADNEFSKLGGASDAETKEAVLMAAHTRHWSTYLNGIQYDQRKFQKEVDQIIAAAKKNAKPKA
ncbi:MAG: carboxymuconolactone decarboxylase family protein [Myxococcota bacterium]